MINLFAFISKDVLHNEEKINNPLCKVPSIRKFLPPLQTSKTVSLPPIII